MSTSKTYVCKTCEFLTSYKQNYERHLTSSRHCINTIEKRKALEENNGDLAEAILKLQST